MPTITLEYEMNWNREEDAALNCCGSVMPQLYIMPPDPKLLCAGLIGDADVNPCYGHDDDGYWCAPDPEYVPPKPVEPAYKKDEYKSADEIMNITRGMC
jgi:hypothetical protein